MWTGFERAPDRPAARAPEAQLPGCPGADSAHHLDAAVGGCNIYFPRQTVNRRVGLQTDPRRGLLVAVAPLVHQAHVQAKFLADQELRAAAQFDRAGAVAKNTQVGVVVDREITLRAEGVDQNLKLGLGLAERLRAAAGPAARAVAVGDNDPIAGFERTVGDGDLQRPAERSFVKGLEPGQLHLRPPVGPSGGVAGFAGSIELRALPVAHLALADPDVGPIVHAHAPADEADLPGAEGAGGDPSARLDPGMAQQLAVEWRNNPGEWAHRRRIGAGR